MKLLEIITAILSGAAMLTLAGYLLVKFLGRCRQNKDELDRNIDREFERHINPKK